MTTIHTGSAARLAIAGVLAFATISSPVAAQSGSTVTNPPKTQEFGLDAGANFGLGDRSSVGITIPAARARIGFFLANNSRWSIEPAAGLAYSKTKDVPYIANYNLEIGALYHFSAPSRLYDATRARVAYLRPFVGLVGVATGGDSGGSDSEMSIGAGYGVKIPWRQNMAFRLEGNAGYGLDNNALRLGAYAGVSFFARNVIPTR